MANPRIEMVVKGQRQAVWSTTPRKANSPLVGSGFLWEEHEVRSFELPDHWIPDYLVALHHAPRPGKRVRFEAGRERESVVEGWGVDVVAPHELRKFRFEGEGRSIILSIKPEVLESVIAGPGDRNAFELIRLWEGKDRILRHLLLKLRSEIQGELPAGPLFAEHLCTKLTEELIRRYSIGKLRLDTYKGGLPGNKLSQAMDYIDSFLDKNLTTDEIGRAVGLSKYHFGKAFSTSAGTTLHRFVLTRRMRRAREFVANSDLPLADIAHAVGFSSQSHFTTVFLERTGVTPGRYRSMHRPVSVAVGL